MSTVDYVKITEKYLTKQGKESKNLQLLPTGTLIYSIYATIGKVSETLFPATINQALLGFIINEDKISKEYLKFVLKNLEEFIIQKSTSSIQNNLNLESIRNTIIPFYSLNTQNKIFKYIKIKYEIVQKENDYLINQLENIKLYKQSLINETIENGGEQI
jgi:restriction endonuclease S subunit